MSETEKLAQLRDEIDKIDTSLIQLISERGHLVQKIANVKRGIDNKVSFYRPDREAQILRKVAEQYKGPLPESAVVRLFREIMSACLALEQPLNIAYLGPEGTFTQIAAQKHFGDSALFYPVDNFNEVFREVEAGTAHYGVVAVENSIEGIVNQTLDLLRHSNLTICGEVQLAINHHLLSQAQSLDELKSLQELTVYAHAQSLAQCRSWLLQNLPNAKCIAVESNAKAARIASEQKNTAAIASAAAAKIYALHSAASHLQDQLNNTTRFLVIGKDQCAACGNDKTSLVFSSPNQPGSLYKMLHCFAQHQVSMTRIESRPSRLQEWDYEFFVDIEGHVADDKVKKALAALKKDSAMVKLLGSYPKAVF